MGIGAIVKWPWFCIRRSLKGATQSQESQLVCESGRRAPRGELSAPLLCHFKRAPALARDETGKPGMEKDVVLRIDPAFPSRTTTTNPRND